MLPVSQVSHTELYNPRKSSQSGMFIPPRACSTDIFFLSLYMSRLRPNERVVVKQDNDIIGELGFLIPLP